MIEYRNPSPEHMGEVLALRWQELRDPSQPMDDTVTDEYDTAPSTVHGAIYQVQFGRLLLTTGRIHTPKGEPGLRQIRYMATRSDRQGMGLGSKLLSAMEAEVKLGLSAGEQVRLVANARWSALPFYEKLGYIVVGDDFELVGIPHVRIEKQL